MKTQLDILSCLSNKKCRRKIQVRLTKAELATLRDIYALAYEHALIYNLINVDKEYLCKRSQYFSRKLNQYEKQSR